MVRSQEVPGSAEVSRGVPRLRGTVSGRLSHTKVFHTGREHAKLLTIANGRRRSKAVTEPAAVSETTVGGGMGSTTRENWANPLAVPSTADPGRPLSPLLSFVSHIFDSASDRLCRRLGSHPVRSCGRKRIPTGSTLVVGWAASYVALTAQCDS